MAATPLHRHQLARLTPAGWADVMSHAWDAEAAACLAHWAAEGLPLVVTRQRDGRHGGTVALGLPAPARWGRRRLALAVPRAAIAYFDEFPAAAQLAPLLPRGLRPGWRRLSGQLAACGVQPRVYGSHGWQAITGLDHVHARSDIDLWIAVADERQADTVTALLAGFDAGTRRVDGELVFDGGAAVAWREWQAWRRGAAARLLAKTVDGVALLDRAPVAWAAAA